MDLTLTAKEQTFQDDLRAWLADNVPEPFEGEQLSPEYFEHLRVWQGKVFAAGYTGLTWPKAYGGHDATPIEQSIFVEEMARARAPDLVGALGISLIGPTIIACGTDAQKKEYLEPMLSGEKVWCQGFSEPNSGSDLASLSTRAIEDGDDFIVNGQKIWTSYAHFADYCFLLVRTDPAAQKHKGITCLLVDMKSPGVKVKPLLMMTGTTSFNEVFFTDVRVPKSQILGELDGGWRVGITALMNERVNLGGVVRVGMSRFIDGIIDASHKLPRPGGGVAADDPLVRQKIAQAHLELEVFRMTSARALSKVAQGGVPGPEGSILKIFWSELNQRTAQSAMEIAGTHSQLTGEDEALEKLVWVYLRSRGNTIEAGTSEVLRNIVAERVLGLPKSY
jgi:alkylation response protein AidB-like acyl-CoA dehydrogenase